MQDDPLSQLRDIHMPAEPGWWPPAPGWWILAALVLLVAAILLWRVVQRYRRNAPRRQALTELAAAKRAYEDHAIDGREYVNRCNALLKRLWVHALGQPHIASLNGDAWLAHLDQVSGSQQFSDGPGAVLGNARFAPAPPEIAPAVHDLIAALLARTAMESGR
jgi:hypothetical protein